MKTWSGTRPDPEARLVTAEINRRRKVIGLFLACTFGLMAAAFLPFSPLPSLPVLGPIAGLGGAGQPVAGPWVGSVTGSLPTFRGRAPLVAGLFESVLLAPGPLGSVSTDRVITGGADSDAPALEPLVRCDPECMRERNLDTNTRILSLELVAFRQASEQVARARKHAEDRGDAQRVAEAQADLVVLRHVLAGRERSLLVRQRIVHGHQAAGWRRWSHSRR